MLHSMGSQRVGHDLLTEQQQQLNLMKVIRPLLVKHLVMGSQRVSGPKTFVYGPILCYRSSQKSGNRGALKSTFCWTLKDQVRECEESIMYINLYIGISLEIMRNLAWLETCLTVS